MTLVRVIDGRKFHGLFKVLSIFITNLTRFTWYFFNRKYPNVHEPESTSDTVYISSRLSRSSSLYVSTETTRACIRRRKYYPLARVSSFFHFIHILRTNRISRNTGFCFVEQRMQQRIFSYALRYDCATLTTTSCFDFFLFLFFFQT